MVVLCLIDLISWRYVGVTLFYFIKMTHGGRKSLFEYLRRVDGEYDVFFCCVFF